jgi:hypothetical protein
MLQLVFHQDKYRSKAWRVRSSLPLPKDPPQRITADLFAQSA